MGVWKKLNLANSVSAAVIATGLCVGAGLATVVMTAMPASAQVTLSAEQVAAIQTSLRAALQAAQTDAAKQAAIAQAAQTAVALYGAGAAGAITSAVMDTAEAAGVAPSLIGTGLAQASAALATTNVAAASAIATTVANEGNAGERGAYQVAATGLGYANLASIAGQGATVTGSTGGGQGGIGAGGTGGGFTAGGAVGGGGGGCLTPSCSSL